MLGMGFVSNWSGLMAARWFLGLTEAGLFPGVNYYLSCWYKRSEFGVRAVSYPVTYPLESFGPLTKLCRQFSSPLLPSPALLGVFWPRPLRRWMGSVAGKAGSGYLSSKVSSPFALVLHPFGWFTTSPTMPGSSTTLIVHVLFGDSSWISRLRLSTKTGSPHTYGMD